MSGTDKCHHPRTDSGFSLVESMMAVFVLALGVLGMAATTTVVTSQVRLSEVNTVRQVGIQSVMERIRSTPYDSISAGADTAGPIVIRWQVVSTNSDRKVLRIVAAGPGPRSDAKPMIVMSQFVVDTITYAVLEP